MTIYTKPEILIRSASQFENVFAKKSGHHDHGHGNSDNTGNIFDDPNGNNGKDKKPKK